MWLLTAGCKPPKPPAIGPKALPNPAIVMLPPAEFKVAPETSMVPSSPRAASSSIVRGAPPLVIDEEGKTLMSPSAMSLSRTGADGDALMLPDKLMLPACRPPEPVVRVTLVPLLRAPVMVLVSMVESNTVEVNVRSNPTVMSLKTDSEAESSI